MRTIAIVGGGITGLAAAYELQERRREEPLARVVLFEASRRVGGKIWTESRDGYILELGPDSFLTRKPAALRLVRSLRLEDRLLPTSGGTGLGSYVWYGGRLHRLPEGLVLMVPSRIDALFRTGLLSWRGKFRALLDLVLPRRVLGPHEDESLASLVGRRLGREVLERIAEPLVAGIHAAHPSTMSLRASFPRLLEMEKEHGSLIRAALAARRASGPAPTAPQPQGGQLSYFVSFRSGMGELVEALVSALRDVEMRTDAPVQAISADSGGFTVHTDTERVHADALILAVPANVAARLLSVLAPGVSNKVASLRSLAVGTYTAAFPRARFPTGHLQGHGFVVPQVAGRRILGVTFMSEKWEGRSPRSDVILLRAFIGGVAQQDIVLKGEEAVRNVAREELAAMLGLDAEPILERTHIWNPGMPQYTLGHVERVQDLEEDLSAQFPNVALAGASYHGIGIPDCIGSGQRAAERIWRWLHSAAHTQ